MITDKFERPGTVIEVVFELNNGQKKQFVLSATVRWVRERALGPDKPAGMGVEFSKVYPINGINEIKKIIEKSDFPEKNNG